MKSVIRIRAYTSEDARELKTLFFDTVHNVNKRDYSESQIKAWASEEITYESWRVLMEKLTPFVAEIDNKIVGYADLQPDGLIDHFYVGHQYQKRGVAGALMQRIYQQSNQNNLSRIYSHVSITAKPFFEHCGFKVIEEQQVDIRGQVLTNFVMELTTLKML